MIKKIFEAAIAAALAATPSPLNPDFTSTKSLEMILNPGNYVENKTPRRDIIGVIDKNQNMPYSFPRAEKIDSYSPESAGEKEKQEVDASKVYDEIKRGLENPELFGKVLQKYPETSFNFMVDGWEERKKNDRGFINGLEEALQRANAYAGDVKRIFHDEGLPREFEKDSLILPLVESEWKNHAESPVGARGAFQLISSTAQNNGAKIHENYDERLNPLIAAKTAAKILKKDFDRIGEREVTLANYNSGGLPRKYLSNKEKFGDGNISLENYVRFLGSEFARDPSERDIIRQNLYFLIKIEGLKKILKENYPGFLEIPPTREFKIKEIPDGTIYKVKHGDSLWSIARNHIERTYGASTTTGIKSVVKAMREQGFDKIIPGERIFIASAKSLSEIEHLTGEKLEKYNLHIDNPDIVLPKDARIVIRLY